MEHTSFSTYDRQPRERKKGRIYDIQGYEDIELRVEVSAIKQQLDKVNLLHEKFDQFLSNPTPSYSPQLLAHPQLISQPASSTLNSNVPYAPCSQGG